VKLFGGNPKNIFGNAPPPRTAFVSLVNLSSATVAILVRPDTQSGKIVATKRHSTFRSLEVLWYQVTGLRHWAIQRAPGEQASIEEVLEGLMVGAYSELLEGRRLVPERFFWGIV